MQVGKGQSVTTTVVLPRSGPNSYSQRPRAGASEQQSLASTASPTSPSSSSAPVHWSLVRSHVGRRRALHWLPRGRRAQRAPGPWFCPALGATSGAEAGYGRRRWYRCCVTWAVPADPPGGLSRGASPRQSGGHWGGPGHCAKVAAVPAPGE